MLNEKNVVRCVFLQGIFPVLRVSFLLLLLLFFFFFFFFLFFLSLSLSLLFSCLNRNSVFTFSTILGEIRLFNSFLRKTCLMPSWLRRRARGVPSVEGSKGVLISVGCLMTQVSSVQDCMNSVGKAHYYALHPVSQKFPQRRLRNCSNVRLIDDGSLSSFQGRS